MLIKQVKQGSLRPSERPHKQRPTVQIRAEPGSIAPSPPKQESTTFSKWSGFPLLVSFPRQGKVLKNLRSISSLSSFVVPILSTSRSPGHSSTFSLPSLWASHGWCLAHRSQRREVNPQNFTAQAPEALRKKDWNCVLLCFPPAGPLCDAAL